MNAPRRRWWSKLLQPQQSSTLVIYAALAGNFMVALTKLGAALWTGSSAMLSESIHSAVDMGNELLLLYGMRRAERKPDHDHPFGYGREVYFWSFVVAILIFTLGAGMSIYEGVRHILQPTPIENAHVSYLVLLASAVFEGGSWLLTLNRFKGKKRYSELFAEFRRSKDPPTFIVLLEDTAAILGLAVAFIGIWCSVYFELPAVDGMASIVIGLILAATAAMLARETKGLLIGERAHQQVQDSIVRLVTAMAGVVGGNGVVTVHLAPHQILAALSVEFEDDLRTPQIEALVIAMEASIRERHPEVVVLFIKPQTAGRYQSIHNATGSAPPGATDSTA